MTREFIFRLLTVGVIAPYVYEVSKEQESDYMSFGLKMVAGSLIMMNIKPILVEAAPLLKMIADASIREAKTITTIQAEPVDAEFTETKTV